MKFTLTITDMTPEEMTTVTNQLGVVEVAPNAPTQIDDDEVFTYHADEYFNTTPTSDDGLDSTGLPWDERIHASTKTKKQDGSWKARKGVDDAVKSAVETELRNQVKAAALPTDAISVYATAPTPVTPTYPQVATPVTPTYPQVTAPAPMTPAYTTPAPVTPAYTTPAPIGNTMQSLMSKFQELLMVKKIQPNFAMQMVQDMNAMYGTTLTSIVDLGQNQQMLDAAFDYINQKVQ